MQQRGRDWILLRWGVAKSDRPARTCSPGSYRGYGISILQFHADLFTFGLPASSALYESLQQLSGLQLRCRRSQDKFSVYVQMISSQVSLQAYRFFRSRGRFGFECLIRGSEVANGWGFRG